MTLYIEPINRLQILSANKRIHYHQRAEAARYWRNLGRLAILANYGTGTNPGQPRHQAARIILTFRWPDNRRHDVGNLYPYVAKPLVDGFIDARLLPDDNDKHLIGPDLRRDPEKGPHRITVQILDIPEDETA